MGRTCVAPPPVVLGVDRKLLIDIVDSPSTVLVNITIVDDGIGRCVRNDAIVVAGDRSIGDRRTCTCQRDRCTAISNPCISNYGIPDPAERRKRFICETQAVPPRIVIVRVATVCCR